MSKRGNILAITYWSYKDALIQAYTLPYLKIIHEIIPGSEITLITKEQGPKIKENEVENIKAALKSINTKWVPVQYTPFGLKAIIIQLRDLWHFKKLIKKNGIEFIHAFGTPAGAIGYFLSLVTGKKLIIDSYEPHAEAQLENGTWTKMSLGYQILWFLEKKQSKRASNVIYTTQNMVEYAKIKYGVEKKQLIKPACVDLKIFNRNESVHDKLRKELGILNEVVAIYAGKFGGIYLDQEVFDLLKEAYKFWNGNFKAVILTSEPRSRIEYFCKESKLNSEVVISLKVSHDEVPNYLGIADFALTPVKPVPTKKCCTPIKDGEYWAMGLPIIIPRNISDDSEIIEEHKIGAILTSFDELAYKEAIVQIDQLLQKDRTALRKKIRSVAEQYRDFSIARKVYKSLYG